MNDGLNCPQCGAPIPADGLCPKCLLQIGLDGHGPETKRFGNKVGDFTLVEKIGEGGFGIVYKAKEGQLKRFVALKILKSEIEGDPEARRRFFREARLAASIDHPFICKIFRTFEAAGKPVFVMEYVDGETLRDLLVRDRPALADCFQMASEVAEALHEAHKCGVVHRDLKPANIMVTPFGHIKVMDFGLAKPVHRAAENTTLTEYGSTLGTLGYMSPEQLRSKPTEQQSDIFSFGIILYEMATGKHPFSGATAAETVNAILSTEPAPPSVLNKDLPPSGDQIILKMLAKPVDQRFQSIREFLPTLDFFASQHRETMTIPPPETKGISSKIKWAAGVSLFVLAMIVLLLMTQNFEIADFGGRQPQRSLAVLPLENLSGDPGQEFVADGMTDALIGNLARLTALDIRSRTSVMRFKGGRLSLPEIAEILNVDTIVEGSVVRSSERIEIRTKIFGIKDGNERLIGQQQMDCLLGDVLTLQREITNAIAQEIKIQLTPEDDARLREKTKVDPDVHEHYLYGLHWLNKRTKEGLGKAVEHFLEATRRDAEFAPAHAGLADAYALQATTALGASDPHLVMPKARESAMMALQLDNTLAAAQTSLAHVSMVYDWDWQEAKKGFERAILLNPNYSTAFQWYALLLAATGESDEAIVMATRAVEIDPLSAVAQTTLARCFYYRKDYDSAIGMFTKALDLDPGFRLGHLGLGLVYVKKGKISEAFSEFFSGFDHQPITENNAADTTGSAQETELVDNLKEILGNWQTAKMSVPAFFLAVYYSLSGDDDLTFTWLQEALEERSGYVIYLRVDPFFDSLRDDPRFLQILEQIG